MEINETRILDLAIALETAAKIDGSVTIPPIRAMELSELIEQYVESYNDLETRVHTLLADNRILREFASDDKKDLTEDDKQVLRGMGIKL